MTRFFLSLTFAATLFCALGAPQLIITAWHVAQTLPALLGVR